MTDSTDPPFDLSRITWGYRQTFALAIEELERDGRIGPQHQEVTDTFFNLLRHQSGPHFDHVLKEFLGALNRRTRWILDLPGVFEDFCDLGRQLADQRLSYALQYFRLWGLGGFGDRPQHVRDLIGHVRTLRELDADLAQAFMSGYGELIAHLDSHEVQIFVNELRQLHHDRPQTALDFAALRLASARTFMRDLSCEARLDDLADRLGRFTRALCERPLRFGDLSQLDVDYMVERNSRVVCFLDHLYLPLRVRQYESRHRNEAVYWLAALVTAATIRLRSFTTIQGRPLAPTITDWLHGDAPLAAVVTLIEIVRVIDHLRAHLPGVRRLLDLGIDEQFRHCPPRTRTEMLLRGCLRLGDDSAVVALIRDAASRSSCIDESAALARNISEQVIGHLDTPVPALAFFPDFDYFAQPGDAAPRKQVLQRGRADVDGSEHDAAPTGMAQPSDGEVDSHEPPDEIAHFFYPEWSQADNDYYDNWCCLREHFPASGHAMQVAVDADDQQQVRNVRRMFERLRPELARKQKYLEYGDEINIDRLVEYLALREQFPNPRIDFYEKTFIRRRDLAIALLIDVSGSTAAFPDAAPGSGDSSHRQAKRDRRIIDLQRHAAMILAEGLGVLGDDFAIYGFSGNGREHCDFFIYKNLDETYEGDAQRRLGAAYPMANTRIGVALRHAQAKLADHPARRKIIIVITDGKPQDSDYDPTTRYAQHDVRMACQEADRAGMHVVCVSTQENSRADLEIMFPHHRFVILDDMTQLADVLPRLYLKMTT